MHLGTNNRSGVLLIVRSEIKCKHWRSQQLFTNTLILMGPEQNYISVVFITLKVSKICGTPINNNNYTYFNQIHNSY